MGKPRQAPTEYAGTGGIERNDKLAIKYYRGAAEAGHPAALTTMGVLYFNGRIVKKSEKKAREKAEAVRRARKLARKRAQREGLLPSKRSR